jgi:hypothetical protein
MPKVYCQGQELAIANKQLLPLIDKDFPAFNAFQLQNTVLGPGVVFQFLSHFVFVLSIED